MSSQVPATPSLPRLAILLCLGLTPLIAGGEDTRRPSPAPPADLAPPTAPAERTARNDLDQLRQALEQDALMLDQARRQLQWLQMNLQELARTLGWLQQRHQWHREMGQRLDRHLAAETATAPPHTPPAGTDELRQQLRAQDRELQQLRGELGQLRQRLQARPKQAVASPTRSSGDPQSTNTPDRDRDGDGVNDARDLCPDTAATTISNRLGCAAGRPMVLSEVRFEYDASRFTPESVPALERIARILQRHPGLSLEIAGHTDAKGDPAYNQWLSRQRAAAVRDFLVDRGVEGNRLSVRGYGPEQPIGDNSTWIGIQKNRRVELRLADTTAQVD